jgi:hypothetical protein
MPDSGDGQWHSKPCLAELSIAFRPKLCPNASAGLCKSIGFWADCANLYGIQTAESTPDEIARFLHLDVCAPVSATFSSLSKPGHGGKRLQVRAATVNCGTALKDASNAQLADPRVRRLAGPRLVVALLRRMRPRMRSLLIALANSLLYSVLLPLWEGFDEPFRFGYVQQLANLQGLPDPRTSGLSREVGDSVLLAPASGSVKQNLPVVTSYGQYFSRTIPRGTEVHNRLRSIPFGFRWQRSEFLNYEAHHPPLAYILLAVPERLLARVSLPARVAFVPLLMGLCASQKRWRELAVACLIVLALAGPWYARNLLNLGVTYRNTGIAVRCRSRSGYSRGADAEPA